MTEYALKYVVVEIKLFVIDAQCGIDISGIWVTNVFRSWNHVRILSTLYFFTEQNCVFFIMFLTF